MENVLNYQKLSAHEKEVLKNEIKEDPNMAVAHIESFRRWVQSMPHLNCPTDSKFLLMFLRVAKYDHSVAQKRLDNFCTVRTSPKGYPHLFKYPKLDNKIIEKVLRSHQNIPIGKNSAGEQILLYKAKDWNPEEISIETLLQIIYMSFDLIICNESTQICGIISVFDLEGCSRKTLEKWSDPQLTKIIMRIWQDSFPIRMKGIVLFKEPTIFRVILKIMEFFMSEKHRKRIIQSDNVEKLFQKIPGLKEIMPIEYCGHGGKLEQAVEKWIKEIEEFYSKGDPWSSISVDENKRPAENTLFLKTYDDYKGETLLGTEGSYTKYNVL